MEDVMLTETELAKRWKVSKRSLQVWRREGKGPKFLNLINSEIEKSKIRYRLCDVVEYENREFSK